MVDRYAVCDNVLRIGELGATLEYVVAAGAAGLGVSFNSVETLGAAEARVLLDDAGVVASTLMSAPAILGQDGEPAAHADRIAAILDVCAVLGAPGVLLTTGTLGDLSVRDADARCTAWLAFMAPLAEERGVRLLLEPVHPLMRMVTYVHTLRHAADLTQCLPGTGLVLDVGHLWWDRHFGEDVSALVAQIGTVQLDDVDAAALDEYRYLRVQLGTGVLPLADMVRTIEGAGYTGFYENEVIARVPREERAAFVAEGGAWLAGVLDGA
jgi:sugar phosphate isomerase/epimerase